MQLWIELAHQVGHSIGRKPLLQPSDHINTYDAAHQTSWKLRFRHESGAINLDEIEAAERYSEASLCEGMPWPNEIVRPGEPDYDYHYISSLLGHIDVALIEAETAIREIGLHSQIVSEFDIAARNLGAHLDDPFEEPS